MDALRLSEDPVTKLFNVSGSPYRGITMAYLVYMLRYIGVHTSKLIQYSLAVVPIRIVIMERLLLTRKQLNQRHLIVKLKSSLRKVDRFGISVSQMTTDMFNLS